MLNNAVEYWLLLLTFFFFFFCPFLFMLVYDLLHWKKMHFDTNLSVRGFKLLSL